MFIQPKTGHRLIRQLIEGVFLPRTGSWSWMKGSWSRRWCCQRSQREEEELQQRKSMSKWNLTVYFCFISHGWRGSTFCVIWLYFQGQHSKWWQLSLFFLFNLAANANAALPPCVSHLKPETVSLLKKSNGMIRTTWLCLLYWCINVVNM